MVSSFAPHHGEERPISGVRGSGTIFFAWCNLRCVYCQNHDISWKGEGTPMAAPDIAAVMLALQHSGCHNINLVSPSHVVAQILEALVFAAAAGLRLPLVYNSGGYDSPEALELLDGVIDIYMPDMKYGDEAPGHDYSNVPDYVAVNRAAVREMHRQVGDLVLDDAGIARRGLLVRHLVLPGNLAGSRQVFDYIERYISPHTYVNVMGQYRPCHRAHEHIALDHAPSAADMRAAFAAAREAGLTRLDNQAIHSGPLGYP